MGNLMTPLTNWEDYPESYMPPKFDPNFGFPKGRKERVMIATEEEMIAAKIPKRHRDYCAHKYITFAKCEREHLPFFSKCQHQKHDYVGCLLEDYTLRMKEYERERRLARRQRRAEAAIKSA